MIYAKSWQPGEENENTYRITVGHDDGHEPTPVEAIAMILKVAQDLIVGCEVADSEERAKAVMHEMIDGVQLRVEKVVLS